MNRIFCVPALPFDFRNELNELKPWNSLVDERSDASMRLSLMIVIIDHRSVSNVIAGFSDGKNVL